MYVDYINMIHIFLTNDLFWNSFRFYRRVVKRAQIVLIYICVCVLRTQSSNYVWPHGLWPTRLLYPWDSQARILQWIAMPFSRRSFWPRDWTRISHISGKFFTTWVTREAPYIYIWLSEEQDWTYLYICTYICTYMYMYVHIQMITHTDTHTYIYEYSLGLFTTLP